MEQYSKSAHRFYVSLLDIYLLVLYKPLEWDTQNKKVIASQAQIKINQKQQVLSQSWNLILTEYVRFFKLILALSWFSIILVSACGPNKPS